MPGAVISIVRTPAQPDREKIAVAVRRAVALAGGLPPVIVPGSTILLKPNLVDLPRTRESGAVTHPALCRAVAEMVLERGALPVIADSAGVGADTEAVIEYMGYAALRRDGLKVLDLKKEKAVRVRNPGAAVLPYIYVYEAALRAAAVINLPVLKTHDQTEVTLGLKNLKGLLADRSKKAMHRRGLFRGVPEIAAFFKPCLTVLDGIYCQEGVGPVFGDPVEMDLVLAGRDPVALDSVAGLIIGYRPEEVPITVLAAQAGLGTADISAIEIAGESWQAVRRPFKRSADSALISGALPCRLLAGGDACTGCRNTVISVLVELKERDMLALLENKTIVTGRPPRGDAPPGELLLVGTCARAWRRKGAYIAGCPPENNCVIKAIEAKQAPQSRKR
jgi:uncharacterized protein (DUF362 family)